MLKKCSLNFFFILFPSHLDYTAIMKNAIRCSQYCILQTVHQIASTFGKGAKVLRIVKGAGDPGVGSINVPGQFAMDWTIGAMVSVTIGGWGTLTGPILGSMIFVILREILGRTLPTAYLVVTGIIFVLVIVFLPDGLVSIGVMIRKFSASLTKGSLTSGKVEDS